MTLPQVYELFDYWREWPPEHELAALLARCFTTWAPEAAAPGPDAHRRSLEARWAAGAMNVKQMFEATGGQPVSLQ